MFNKFLYSLSFFLVLCLKIHSQSSISPIVGVDFTALINKNQRGNFNVQDNVFELNSFLWGVSVEHIITPKYSLALTSFYTKKDVEANSIFAIPTVGFKYNVIQNNLSLKYNFKNNQNIGLGGNLNLLRNFEHVYANNNIGNAEFIDRLSHFGFTALYEIEYKNVCLNFYYYQGVTSFDKTVFNFYPIMAFGLYTGYKFKYPNK